MTEDEFWAEGMPALAARFPGVHALVEDDEGMIFIASIWADAPGTGEATRFMEGLHALADECGLDIGLDPSVKGGARLAAWYERLGYQEARWGRVVRYAEPAEAPGPR